jgi:carboxyl-terminal processing protease
VIELGETTGAAATLGNMPTFYMTIETRQLPENVTCFGFSMFMDPPRLMPAYQQAVEQARLSDGFIIDLRGNPGGIGALAMAMGGWLVEEDNIKLGTMTSRTGTFNFIMNPRLNAYTGPVAILIDGLSGSTSEIFAGGMKDIGRARIFGERSAGAALPSVFETLPNGDRFQYAIANYVSVGGRPLEGEGVTPDEEVIPDRGSLLQGRDPVIDAAVRWIKSQKASGAAAGGADGGKN